MINEPSSSVCRTLFCCFAGPSTPRKDEKTTTKVNEIYQIRKSVGFDGHKDLMSLTKEEIRTGERNKKMDDLIGDIVEGD